MCVYINVGIRHFWRWQTLYRYFTTSVHKSELIFSRKLTRHDKQNSTKCQKFTTGTYNIIRVQVCILQWCSWIFAEKTETVSGHKMKNRLQKHRTDGSQMDYFIQIQSKRGLRSF